MLRVDQLNPANKTTLPYRIDLSLFDVKGPRSVELGDIEMMIADGVFSNSKENICRLDIQTTKG
jgi:hypothetical protein